GGRVVLLRRIRRFRQREAGRTGSPRVARGRSKRGAVRSVDAHRGDLAVRVGRTFAFLWLMTRKRPGKICRHAAVSPFMVKPPQHHVSSEHPEISRHCLGNATWHDPRIVNGGSPSWEWRQRSGGRPRGEHRMPGIRSARLIWLACAALLALALSPAGATSRIKDLANIEGVRQNQLIGYGLVVGLNGTGDTLNNIPFTRQSLQAMLERLGVNIRGQTLRTGNVAAVMVTANLPAFSTQGTRIASAVNDFIGAPTAEPLDPSTVQLTIPKKFQGNVVALLTEIEQLQVEPDLAAKVIIDERSGIIVMGRDVRASTVAVAQGNLTVTISETPQVSQPQPFSRGQTVVVPRTRVGVQEDGRKLAVVKEGVSLQQLVDGLNALGVGPRDLISILQAIKAAGAIQADIEVM